MSNRSLARQRSPEASTKKPYAPYRPHPAGNDFPFPEFAGGDAVSEPTPPGREPPFTLQLGPDTVHVRIDDGEEDNTIRTSDEIRRRCAEMRKWFGEEVALAPGEPDCIHVLFTEDDPGTEVWSWTPPPPPVSDETKG
jgi:hypothetical protein